MGTWLTPKKHTLPHMYFCIIIPNFVASGQTNSIGVSRGPCHKIRLNIRLDQLKESSTKKYNLFGRGEETNCVQLQRSNEKCKFLRISHVHNNFLHLRQSISRTGNVADISPDNRGEYATIVFIGLSRVWGLIQLVGIVELLTARCLFSVEYFLPNLRHNAQYYNNETKWFIIKYIEE